MRGQRLLIVTLGVAILINLCSSIHTNSTETGRNGSKRGSRGSNAQLESRLSEMAKEFGATSFEETSEESTSSNEDSHAPKQHVKRLISSENHQQEFEVYQGVMGRPGIDFPVLPSIPKTPFSCRNVKSSGYYADLDTDCQVFHICADGRKISFLCPNGTIFRQSHLICDWWWTVDCASSREQYDESAELLAHDRKVYHQDRSEALSKARAAQRGGGGGKQSLISYEKEYEVGASATVTSVSTEPNARVVGRTRAPKMGKYFLTSPKPSLIKDISHDAPFSSDYFQGGSSMELAEQRGFHSYHTPPGFTYKQENRQQISADHNIFSESTPTQLPPQGTRAYEASSFSQSFPSSTENIYQYQDVSTPATLDQTINPVPTTHRPFFHSKQSTRPTPNSRRKYKGRTLENQQFSQIQPEQLKQRDTLNTYKEQPRKRFPQPQTTVASQTNRPKYSRSKPTQQTNVDFEKEEQNNGNDDKYFSSTEGEGQQLAETGSFFGNRANQLDNVHHKIQATTFRPSSERTTSTPTVTSTELPNDPFVDISKIKPQAPAIDEQQSGRPIVIPETGFGVSGPFSSSWEQGNSANYYDDVVNVPEVEDEEPFDEDVHPPSAEQFKDEDIFYLRISTSEKSVSTTTTSKPTVSQAVVNEGIDGPIDLIGDFRLPESNSETLFEDYPIAVHSTSESPHNSHSSVIRKSSSASYISSTTPVTTTEEQSKIEQVIVTSAENKTVSEDQYGRIPAFSGDIPEYIRSNETASTAKIEVPYDETKGKFESLSTVGPRYEVEKVKPLLDIENVEAITSEEFESIKTKLHSTTTLPEKYSDAAENFSQVISEDIAVKEEVSDDRDLKNNTNEEINSYSTDTLQISVTSEDPVTVDTTTELVTRSKPRNLRKRLRSRTTTPSTKEPNIVNSTEASIESSASSLKGVQFPKRDKGKVLSPFLRTTTFSPPTTVYVTLSRRVKPPVLILSSTDPRETASSKIRESFRNRNKNGKSKTELDKSSTLPIDVESTTPIPALNVSRRVKPPRYNSSALLSKRNKNQNARRQKFSTTPLPEHSTESTVLPTLPISTTKSPIELLSTSSSKHGRVYPSSTLVPSSKLRSTTEAAPTDSSTIKEDLGLRNLIRETEKIPQLKQEPTSIPQHGNRVGLNIPASSAPATLHSLAAYFADKENSEGSATVSSETVSIISSGKANPAVNSITSTSIPTTEVYIASTTVDESESPPEFLTQAIKDSYSALFPKKKTSTTTQAPTTATRIINKERETSGSEQNELRNQLLDKLVEMSHMDTLPEAERNRTIELMRNMPHSDTEDLLQGTDSRDLRELAQIFSRALSAYLENPEEFKRVLNGIRPTEPPVISGKGLEDYNSNSVSSTSTTESTSHEDDEVLHFSDVPNVPQRKRISTTAVPIYRSSSPLPPTFVDVNFLSESSTVLTKISTTPADLGDVDTAPPNERLEKSESSYYSSKEEATTAIPVEETSYVSSTFKPNDTESSDYNLPADTKENKEPAIGLQSGGSLNFSPTAGGVSDPTRPRYGGFQNNSQDLKRNNGQENKTGSVNFSEINESVSATTFTPSVRYTAKEKETETTTEAKYTALPEAIGNILATFAPEDLNNLAIADDDDVEEESSTVTSETSTISDIVEESLVGANTASFGSSKQYHSNYIKSDKKLSEPVNAIAINRELSESNINVESIALNGTHETSTAAESTGKLQQKENSNVYTNSEIRNVELITSTPSYVAETSSYTETTEPPRTTVSSQKFSESVLYLTDNSNRTLQSLKLESESPSAVPLIQTTDTAQDTTSEYLSNKLQKEYSERYVSASASPSVIRNPPQAPSYIPHHSIFSNINCSSFTKKIPDETTQLPDSTTPADAVKDSTEIIRSSQSRYSVTTTTVSTQVKEDNLEKDSSNEEPITVQVTTTESPYEQPSVTLSTLLPEGFAIRTHSPITTTDLPSTFATEKTNERVLEGSSPKESVINSLSYSVVDQTRQEKKIETNIPSKLSTSKASFTSTGIPTSSFGESKQQKIEEIESAFASTGKPETEESDEPMTVEQIEALEHLQTMLFPTDAPIVEDGKMFGNLNESSTLLLINTMKQAVTNSTVRRLVLLLVNSLKDGTPEETRDILIEALLRIPCERREEAAASQYESFTLSKIEEKTTNTYSTTPLPVTTTRISSRKVSVTQASLDKEETKTVSPVSAETINEENTSNSSSTVREGKNLSESESSDTEEDTLPESDTRAVELLRSLYSLASRWG